MASTLSFPIPTTTAAVASLAAQLGRATLAWQPIVETWSGHTVAHEALLRCDHPAFRGPPALLRQSALLGRQHQVEDQVLDLVVEQLPLLPATHDLFVNVSPGQMCRGLLGSAADPLRRFADRVVLEVTETGDLPGGPALDAGLRRARDAGYRIALDDLGAGADLLARLLALEADVYKLDRLAIDGCARDARKRRFVSMVVALAREEGARVVAEGVETAEDWHTACALGCDLAQGYLFGRPTRLGRSTLPLA